VQDQTASNDGRGTPKENIDPITLQIQWSRLVSIMDEVDIALLRTAFSTIVSETRDYAVILLDRHARSIAQAQICVAHFTGSLPAATRTMLQEYPAETLVPGDVLITNDPWLCHGHLPDFYIVTPIFHGGEIVAYIATAAHMADVGGRLDELNARDLFEEGLRIPPSKLYEAGRPNTQLFKIIAANTRTPRLVLGDISAIVGAAKIGTERYFDLIADYGVPALDRLAETILDRSEAAMRAAIKEIPDGIYEDELYCDGVRTPTKIRVAITVRGSDIALDYTGSSPQSGDSSVNVVPNVTHSHSLMALKCSLCPELPNNEGIFRPIRTSAPEGSVLNARFPAAVRARSKTSFHTHTAIYAALAQVIPDQVQAASGSFWSMRCLCVDDDGDPFLIYVLPNGGQGASSGMDGHSTTAFPGNGTITPVEVIENGGPVLVAERSLRVDSGGAGRHRGGLGQVIRLRTRDGRTVRMTIRPDKMRYPASGLDHGQPGAAGIIMVDGVAIPPDPFLLRPGQEFTLMLPGGGGFGDPAHRDPALLRRDVERGLVSGEAARTVYGATEIA
jgi:N-methylhydantoinase B/oxoprolinase/acetone carboxylase alpha subunit